MREKLIELVCEGMQADGCLGHCDHQPCYYAEYAADHLIANGVTLQEWIPVSERLPEEMYWVLCGCVDGEIHILRYDYLMDDWDIHDRPNSCYGKGFVTHWMPLPKLPQPPEGE